MSNLDHLVKGKSSETESIRASSTNVAALPGKDDSLSLQDPLLSLSSSPTQIYLNLLILEASLRVQWLRLRTRRRQHTFFLTLLASWIMYFGYALFLAPREDGSGVGGSVYWVVEVVEKLCFLCGIVTGVLVWGTGQWERGIRWPRRWVYCTNRGLRVFNCKLVVIKQSWWMELYSMVSLLFSYGLIAGSSRSSYRYTDQSILRENEKISRSGSHSNLGTRKDSNIETPEEDLTPGGDYIKLLLLPKSFSAKFREDWDIYRTEYWEKENERRAMIRKALHDREKRITKQRRGTFWWIGSRAWNKSKQKANDRANNSLCKHGSSERDKPRLRSTTLRPGSNLRNSSQDFNTGDELDDKLLRDEIRRDNSASSNLGKRRKRSGIKRQMQTSSNSSPSMLDYSSRLTTQSSLSSVSSVDSEQNAMMSSYPGLTRPRRQLALSEATSESGSADLL